MSTTTLRTKFAPLLAAFGVALAAFSISSAVGPISAAHAEDNDVDYAREREEACDTLKDAYDKAVQYASEDLVTHPDQWLFWQNQIESIYFDAQFDWGCDWAVEGIHSAGGTIAPTLVGHAPAFQTAGPNRTPSYAVTNARTYRRWLHSKQHSAGCRDSRKVSRSFEDQAQADLIRLVAHFTHCGWARQLPTTTDSTAIGTPPQPQATTTPEPEPSGGTTEPDSSAGTTEPDSSAGPVAPSPSRTATPPTTSDSGGSTDSGPLL